MIGFCLGGSIGYLLGATVGGGRGAVAAWERATEFLKRHLG
ncbi:outer membrane lipoprotein SlyB [Streptosporangium album]|uniref:Outer membrane lipoprotein SlyB n=1 Tax=Streptosporangium album TaxID=47479 RepID=A0A7W7RU33_9ACTN|nr:hypothetical protein [Streptosporangium album]MBB4938211.1 outer membrane lipoprotein SlyB [Streptosporangium album]